MFDAPPGYLFTDSLAAALAKLGRRVVWLRLGPEDRDPATLLLSLMGAAKTLQPAAGSATLARMRRKPGPLNGWSPLFTHLASELSQALTGRSAIVLEYMHYLDDPALELIGSHFLPALPAGVACVLTTHRHLPREVLPTQTDFVNLEQLRVDSAAAFVTGWQSNAELFATPTPRAVTLTQGRVVALANLLEASAVLGVGFVQQVVSKAAGMDDLFARIAQAWLASENAISLESLALALELGYSHPAIVQAVFGAERPSTGPWLQPLSDCWTHLRQIWQVPLRKVIRTKQARQRDVLRRAADALASNEASDQAIELYLQVGDKVSAAKVIARVAESMMNVGQWQTLERWLGQLPASVLSDWPWLIYLAGELAVMKGRADAARKTFAATTALFSKRHDAEGACQSLLGESALAAWRGEHAYAQERAFMANTLAGVNNLPWYQGWAVWQLGCLAGTQGALDDVLAYYEQATAAATLSGDPWMAVVLPQAQAIAQQQRALRQQRDFYRQAYLAAEQAEQDVTGQYARFLNSSPGAVDNLLGVRDWLHTPLMLKIDAASKDLLGSPAHASRWWDTLLRPVGLQGQLSKLFGAPSEIAPSGSALNESIAPHDVAQPVALPPHAAADPTPSMPALQRSSESPRSSFAIYCLGSFRAHFNEQPVTGWSSQKSLAIFKYLAAHHREPVAKDVLMDLFWPDTDPEAARRNLHQAIYSLRQMFKRVQPDVQVVCFEDERYLLNPEIELWLDFEQFEAHLQAGKNLANSGQGVAAMQEYAIADGLYQGDFLAEDLYVDWPKLMREHLNASYLELADRLSDHFQRQGQYSATIAICEKMLTLDACREEAHRRLMLCYYTQGQRHLAIRQYQLCAQALRQELDITPSRETVELLRRITSQS